MTNPQRLTILFSFCLGAYSSLASLSSTASPGAYLAQDPAKDDRYEACTPIPPHANQQLCVLKQTNDTHPRYQWFWLNRDGARELKHFQMSEYVHQRLSFSGSGRYYVEVSTGEGHPTLILGETKLMLQDKADQPLQLIVDPYPGSIDYRWSADDLYLLTDVNLTLPRSEREPDGHNYCFFHTGASTALEPVDCRELPSGAHTLGQET